MPKRKRCYNRDAGKGRQRSPDKECKNVVVVTNHNNYNHNHHNNQDGFTTDSPKRSRRRSVRMQNQILEYKKEKGKKKKSKEKVSANVVVVERKSSTVSRPRKPRKRPIKKKSDKILYCKSPTEKCDEQTLLSVRQLNLNKVNLHLGNARFIKLAFWRTLLPKLLQRGWSKTQQYATFDENFGTVYFETPESSQKFTSIVEVINYVSSLEQYESIWRDYENDLKFMRKVKVPRKHLGYTLDRSLMSRKCSRVGNEFQALNLPNPSKRQGGVYQRNDGIHLTGKSAKDFVSMFQSKWPKNVQDDFHVAIMNTNKNFHNISKLMNKAIDECHRYYYGFYKHSQEYFIFKQMRRLGLLRDRHVIDGSECPGCEKESIYPPYFEIDDGSKGVLSNNSIPTSSLGDLLPQISGDGTFYCSSIDGSECSLSETESTIHLYTYDDSDFQITSTSQLSTIEIENDDIDYHDSTPQPASPPPTSISTHSTSRYLSMASSFHICDDELGSTDLNIFHTSETNEKNLKTIQDAQRSDSETKFRLTTVDSADHTDLDMMFCESYLISYIYTVHFMKRCLFLNNYLCLVPRIVYDKLNSVIGYLDIRYHNRVLFQSNFFGRVKYIDFISFSSIEYESDDWSTFLTNLTLVISLLLTSSDFVTGLVLNILLAETSILMYNFESRWLLQLISNLI